jgi:hypothetical protein
MRAEAMERMSRSSILEHALRQAPGRPVILIRPAPVRVRAVVGNALAYTITHVLVEWLEAGEYRVHWEASWQVRRIRNSSQNP